jgi:hypothetical protein
MAFVLQVNITHAVREELVAAAADESPELPSRKTFDSCERLLYSLLNTGPYVSFMVWGVAGAIKRSVNMADVGCLLCCCSFMVIVHNGSSAREDCADCYEIFWWPCNCQTRPGIRNCRSRTNQWSRLTYRTSG